MPGFYYYGYDLTYLMLMIPVILILIVAQIRVKSAYSKYSRIGNQSGMTGAAAAAAVLEQNGVYGVSIEMIAGQMTDHYDPKANSIRLSEQVYGGASIAAVGIAAHEAGHAVQYAQSYVPIKLRAGILPLARYGPMLTVPLMIAGFALDMMGLVWLAIALFGAAFLFQLVTLPVEFNASQRAMEAIDQGGLLNAAEAKGARSVLTAAAMTYVAAMLQSLVQLVWFFLRARRR